MFFLGGQTCGEHAAAPGPAGEGGAAHLQGQQEKGTYHCVEAAGMRIRHFSHGSGSGSAEKKFRIRPEIEMKKKIYLYFR